MPNGSNLGGYVTTETREELKKKKIELLDQALRKSGRSLPLYKSLGRLAGQFV